MTVATPTDIQILSDHPISTWYNCGGRAKRFARPAGVEQLRRCVEIDPALRILGEGANLLVADRGVDELVVRLDQGEFTALRIDQATATAHVGAGYDLMKLIHETHKAGLTGLENLGGIPASVGGAVTMNAGGTFGQIADYVHAVHGVTRKGEVVRLARNQIIFDYRHTDLGKAGSGMVITTVELKLKRAVGEAGAAAARAKLKEVMAYKKKTQPMGADSCGCAFKNPTLLHDLRGIAVAGTRVSAGMLIDKAGCKGLSVGGATVSAQHGNFLYASSPACTAADLIALMRQVREKVKAMFDVTLQNEVVIWGDSL
ncbi:MAG TPA: UDP-N-acetylmuramate dehydrogenase [Phycisphaerales bacterium]|nr:UDP-N-acetylmuramate dehydrogenase [Phycisphaerales bacterium]